MVSQICIETDFVVPIWCASDARKALDEYAEGYDLPSRIDKITYKESFMIIVTKFSVSIYGSSPGAIKMFSTQLVDELGAC